MILAVLLLIIVPMAQAKTIAQKAAAVATEGSDVASQKNVVTVNPLGLIFGLWNARYERALGDSAGIGLGLNYWGFGLTDWKYSILGGQLDYNFYLEKHALTGWFVGPHLGIQVASISYKWINLITLEETNDTASSVFVNIGGQGGYRWIWNGGFTLALSGSLGYNAGSSVTIGGVTSTGFGGIGFGAAADIGYAF